MNEIIIRGHRVKVKNYYWLAPSLVNHDHARVEKISPSIQTRSLSLHDSLRAWVVYTHRRTKRRTNGSWLQAIT